MTSYLRAAFFTLPIFLTAPVFGYKWNGLDETQDNSATEDLTSFRDRYEYYIAQRRDYAKENHKFFEGLKHYLSSFTAVNLKFANLKEKIQEMELNFESVKYVVEFSDLLKEKTATDEDFRVLNDQKLPLEADRQKLDDKFPLEAAIADSLLQDFNVKENELEGMDVKGEFERYLAENGIVEADFEKDEFEETLRASITIFNGRIKGEFDDADESLRSKREEFLRKHLTETEAGEEENPEVWGGLAQYFRDMKAYYRSVDELVEKVRGMKFEDAYDMYAYEFESLLDEKRELPKRIKQKNEDMMQEVLDRVAKM